MQNHVVTRSHAIDKTHINFLAHATGIDQGLPGVQEFHDLDWDCETHGGSVVTVSQQRKKPLGDHDYVGTTQRVQPRIGGYNTCCGPLQETKVMATPSEGVSENKSGSPAVPGDKKNRGDVRDILTGLPRRVHDLCDRWLVLRRRGLRPQDITEMLGFVHYLSELLQNTALVRLRGSARRLEDRLRFHSNAMMALGAHEQETLSALFQNLRATLEEEWRDLGFASTQSDPSETETDDSFGPLEFSAGAGSPGKRLILLLDPDPASSRVTRNLLSAHGYSVRGLSQAAEMATVTLGAKPCTIIADLDHWTREHHSETLARAGTDAPPSRTRVLFLATDVSIETRLRGLRSGGHALLPKPIESQGLLHQLAAWDNLDSDAPLKCLLIESDPARLGEIRAAFAAVRLGLVQRPDLTSLPEAVKQEMPDVVILPWDGPAASGPEVAQILRQDQGDSLLPLLFAMAPERAGDASLVSGLGNASGFDQTNNAKWLADLAIAQAMAYREHSADLKTRRTLDIRTGLLHVCAFEQAIQHRMTTPHAEGQATAMALLHLELDGYDLWCSECDVPALNTLLARVASTLAREIGPRDLAASLGDGRFGILTIQPDMDAAVGLANRVREGILGLNDASPVGEWHLSSSIGLCRLTPDEEAFIFMNRARHLAHDARQLGGNRVQRETAVLDTALSDEERQVWTERVRSSITEKRLYLVFQPIATLAADKAIRRFEVLLRVRGGWTQSLDIGEFFRMAEEVGLSRWVDRWVLQQAIDALVTTQLSEPETHFFVKLSKATLQDQSFREWLEATLNRRQPKPGTLVLEISAADVMLQPARLQVLLEEMRAISVPVAMEHLGVDEDAVRLLQELHPDFVKFQASVTAGLAPNTHALERLRHVLALAQSRGIKTMAAYVEDAAGLAVLWQSRFDLIQGNFLRQPEQELDHDIDI